MAISVDHARIKILSFQCVSICFLEPRTENAAEIHIYISISLNESYYIYN